MANRLFGGLAVLIVAYLAFIAIEEAPFVDKDYIAVVGEGKASAFPDFATFTFRFVGEGETASIASRSLSDSAADLIDALTDFGVPVSKVSTTKVALVPNITEVRTEYGWTEEQDGFLAQYSMSVEFDDFERLGDLLALLPTIQDGEIDDLEYHVADPVALTAKARLDAIENGRLKAQVYAEGINQSLGSATILEESGVSDFRLIPSLQKEVADGGYRSDLDEVTVWARRRAVPGSILIVPAEIEISVRIFMKYHLN